MFKSSAPKLNDSMLHSVAGQQEMPLAAVSDCQQDAVRFFPEHRRRDPKGPTSAHVAPVCHMHYDAACPQWNGLIAVASRCTSKTTRLRIFTSLRQVTNVYLWSSNRSKYCGHGRFTRCDRGAHLGQD